MTSNANIFKCFTKVPKKSPRKEGKISKQSFAQCLLAIRCLADEVSGRAAGLGAQGWAERESAVLPFGGTARPGCGGSSGPGRDCSPRSTHEAKSESLSYLGHPTHDTNGSKEVQSARAEGTFSPGKRQVRSSLTAACNGTESWTRIHGKRTKAYGIKGNSNEIKGKYLHGERG